MRDGFEIGIEGQFKGEIFPDGPVGIGGGGSTRRDAGFDIFFRKAEVTAEIICFEGVHV